MESEQLTGVSVCNIVTMLQKCRQEKNLGFARILHLHIREKGLEEHSTIGNYLVPTLADCGALTEAQQVFDMLKHKNNHSWTFLIQGYVDCGEFEHALDLFHVMKKNEVSPNRYTLQLILRACAKLQKVGKGYETHSEVIESGLEGNQFVASTLVDMYVKCGLLEEAQDVFDELDVQDIVSWTALIAGYAEHGPYEKALYCVQKMQAKGMFPDSFTFVCTLKACTKIGAVHKGQEVHQEVVKAGFEGEAFVGSALVDMYAKCVSLSEAENVFCRLLVHDVVVWNVVIGAYAEHGERTKAAGCLRKMRQQCIAPNALTFISLLQGYDGSGFIDEVQNIHIEVTKEGLEKNSLVGSALVSIYSKSGALGDSQSVFDNLRSRNVVCWTALLSGYADHGFGTEALGCLERMQADGVIPNDVTFVCCLKACGQLGALYKGRELHSLIAIEGFESDAFVGNTLVDMYARCGMLLEARDVFNELHVQDVVSWNAMSSRYLEHGFDEEALNCLDNMKELRLSPDLLTYVGCLKACGCLGASGKGQQLHADITVEAFEEDSFVCSSVVDMYSRCGLLLEAHDVFDEFEIQDVVVWNTLLAGYAFKGESNNVFDLLEKMKRQGVEPNGISYLSALTACSHEGIVAKGLLDFQVLTREHFDRLSIQHYNCIVDLLGRAGRLLEAVAILKEFPCQPNLITWSTLLGACLKSADVKLARHAFESAHKRDENNAALFIAMSRIYASASIWEDAKLVHSMGLNTAPLQPQKTGVYSCSEWWNILDNEAE